MRLVLLAACDQHRLRRGLVLAFLNERRWLPRLGGDDQHTACWQLLWDWLNQDLGDIRPVDTRSMAYLTPLHRPLAGRASEASSVFWARSRTQHLAVLGFGGPIAASLILSENEYSWRIRALRVLR